MQYRVQYVKTAAVASYDSDSANLDDVFADMNNLQNARTEEFGFKDYVAGFSTHIAVSKDTIPEYEKLEKTALVVDKLCIICLKSSMNLAKLSQHLLNGHDLFFMGEEDDSTFDDWIFAESMLILPSQNMRY